MVSFDIFAADIGIDGHKFNIDQGNLNVKTLKPWGTPTTDEEKTVNKKIEDILLCRTVYLEVPLNNPFAKLAKTTSI